MPPVDDPWKPLARAARRGSGYDPEHHGPRQVTGPGFHERVFAVVARVPPGRVTTYGDVAAALGLRSVARQVGYALAALPPERDDVPWHRVVNAKGRISPRGQDGADSVQAARLRAEGVPIDPEGRIAGFAKLRVRLV